MNTALIIAGGVGQRTNQDIPKQFLHLNDKPIIVYTLENFENHQDISQIVVVCVDGWHEALNAYCKQFNITKLAKIISGGETRHESVKKGIFALQEKMTSADDVVLIHDANRPILSSALIDECIAGAKAHGACVPVIPCSDWMLHTVDGESSSRSMPRGEIVRAQSPEAACYPKAYWAYTQADRLDTSQISGLSSILIELGEKIHFVSGSEKMMKITNRDDLDIIRAIIENQNKGWLK